MTSVIVGLIVALIVALIVTGRTHLGGKKSGSSQPMYTALGGSNTCGHGLKNSKSDAFQQLILRGLVKRQVAFRLQPSCIPAMGPDYSASCLNYFVPNTTRYATLEFTPNLGEGHELERNALHLEQMARALMARGVYSVLISLVPHPPACESCAHGFLLGHNKALQVARRTGLPLVTNKYSAEPGHWSTDFKHLNELGHRIIADAVLAAFDGTANTREEVGGGDRNDGHPYTVHADDVQLPACVFGADLEPLMLPGSRGFALTWQAGRYRDKPGLLTTQPNSLLRMCLRKLPPAFGVSLALDRSDVLPMSNLTLGCEKPCVCPLELLSNGDWTLRYKGKGGRRATESYMHRIFGSRRTGMGKEASSCDCVLNVRNTARIDDPNARAKINGLVAGGSDMIGWANRFHMGLNPNVLSG